MQRITLALLLVLSATHGLSVNDLYVARNYENSDIVDLIKVTKAIGRASGEKEGLLLSFTPALATGGIQNEPRLNMEMFSFRPDLDADAVAKLGLANENFLKEKIRSKGYLVIALSKERFFGDHNMGKVISPYRESLMATITENYSLFEVIPTGRFEGEFRIFIPKQS